MAAAALQSQGEAAATGVTLPARANAVSRPPASPPFPPRPGRFPGCRRAAEHSHHPAAASPALHPGVRCLPLRTDAGHGRGDSSHHGVAPGAGHLLRYHREQLRPVCGLECPRGSPRVGNYFSYQEMAPVPSVAVLSHQGWFPGETWPAFLPSPSEASAASPPQCPSGPRHALPPALGWQTQTQPLACTRAKQSTALPGADVLSPSCPNSPSACGSTGSSLPCLVCRHRGGQCHFPPAPRLIPQAMEPLPQPHTETGTRGGSAPRGQLCSTSHISAFAAA